MAGIPDDDLSSEEEKKEEEDYTESQNEVLIIDPASTPMFQSFSNSPDDSETEDGFTTPVLPAKRTHNSSKNKALAKRSSSSKKSKHNKKSKKSKIDGPLPDLISSEEEDNKEEEDALSDVDFSDQVNRIPSFPIFKLCGYLHKEPMYQQF